MTGEMDLKAAIAKGRLTPVYLLVGNDSYLVRRYAELIAKKAVPENEDLNLFAFAQDCSVQQMSDSLYQISFTGERICVSVANYSFEDCPIAEFKKLQSLVEQAPDRNVLVLYYDVQSINTKKSDRYKKLAKSVEKGGGTVCELNHKTEGELVKMLCDGAARRRIRLDAATAKYMVAVCSNDLNILINELEKLAAFAGQDGTVTREMIDRVCVKTVEASVYDLSRHILAGRGERAFRLLDQLMEQGVSPAEIHALICSAYVDIFRVKAATAAGKQPESIAAEFGYAPNRAFVLRSAARDARGLSDRQLDRVMDQLLKADAQVKSEDKQSAGSAKIALERLITAIMGVSARGARS